MDWVGIIVFILFMVLKALGESEKQKKQRQARQRRMSPPEGSPTVADPPLPPPEVPRPVAKPDFDLPPVLPFPLFELLGEDEEEWLKEKEAGKEVLTGPEVVPDLEQIIEPEVKQPVFEPAAAEPELTVPPLGGQSPTTPGMKPVAGTGWPGLQLNRAMEGVIWAEILGPPRALRPFRR